MLWFKSKRAAFFLLPLALLYRLVVTLRNVLYDKGLFAIYRPPCKAISIGNITVGGTGKTPTVQFLANELRRRGRKVVIISRGYARKSRGTIIVSDGNLVQADAAVTGDEPLLLARNCPDVPVIVDADRVRAAQTAVQRFAPEVILLDDGFQHRRLGRDFDLVTMRAVEPLGNGWCLPAGPLREPIGFLRRADYVLFTGGSCPDSAMLQRLSKPWSTAPYCFGGAVDKFGNVLSTETLKNMRVVAFCGLANPTHFYRMLDESGIIAIARLTFPDHHYYGQLDIIKIKRTCERLRAEYVLTTEKDWVKLEPSRVEANWLMIKMVLNDENLSDLLSRIENVLD